MQHLLQQWRQHFDAGEHLQAECALKAFCALPRLFVANKPRARNRAIAQRSDPHESHTTPLHTKIALAHEARWRELWKFHEHPEFAGTSRPMSLKQQALETEACIAAGALGKALQCVKGKTPLARPAEAAAAVPCLFPQAAIPPWTHTEASLADDNAAFGEAVRRSILRSPKRSGAGPDGMRYEHLRCLLLHDPANQDIAYLLEHYLKGTLPPTVIAAFGAGTLVPLQKPGGRGVRPLVIGTVLHRVAARALCNTFAARMAEATAPNQFGSHRSAGGEKMHKIALALTTVDLDLCVLSIDLSNAFQCVHRIALTTEINRRLPALLPWLRTILGEASDITMSMPDTEPVRFQQTAGLRQGCPLSPLLFALASSPIVEELHRFTSADGRSGHTLAYVDDVTCLIKPEHIADTLSAAAVAAQRMGLAINTRKCTVWCPPGAAARLPAGAAQLERAPTPIVLGQFLEPAHLYFEAGPDGDSQLDPDDSTCQALLDKRRGFVARLFDLTRNGLSKQAAHCLLRLFAASDATWTARTMGLPAATATQLDDILVGAIKHLHNWSNFNAHMALKAFMPVAEGGLGYASCAAMRAGAIASSWALCLRDVLDATGHADLMDLAFYARPLAPALNLTRDLHVEILGAAGEVALPLPPSQIIKQRAFTQHATKRLIEEWENHPETTPQLAAWRHSAGGSHAGAWLQFPSQPSHFMPDEIFDLSVRIRMADDILRPGPCPLRGANGTPCPGFCDAKGHHAMCCTYGAGAVKRHEAVANTLHKLLHNWGHTPVYREQLVPTDHDNRKRADIIYTDAENRSRPIDVMIVGPTSVQALALGAARKRGTAANSGENLKFRQYGLQRVTPAVIEAAGLPGPALKQLIKSTVPADEDRSSSIQTAFQALACAMHSQQAHTILNLLRRDGTRPDVDMASEPPAGITSRVNLAPRGRWASPLGGAERPPHGARDVGGSPSRSDAIASGLPHSVLPAPLASSSGADRGQPPPTNPTLGHPGQAPGAQQRPFPPCPALDQAAGALNPLPRPWPSSSHMGHGCHDLINAQTSRRWSTTPPVAKRPPPPVPPEFLAARALALQAVSGGPAGSDGTGLPPGPSGAPRPPNSHPTPTVRPGPVHTPRCTTSQGTPAGVPALSTGGPGGPPEPQGAAPVSAPPNPLAEISGASTGRPRSMQQPPRITIVPPAQPTVGIPTHDVAALAPGTPARTADTPIAVPLGPAVRTLPPQPTGNSGITGPLQAMGQPAFQAFASPLAATLVDSLGPASTQRDDDDDDVDHDMN